MAGRGRGGKTSSFTQEQLQALGCAGKDTPGATLTPPPLFPQLITKPVPLEINADRDYKILWKEDFLTFLKDSPYYMHSKKLNKNCDRYSDAVENVLENDLKSKSNSEFNWELLPLELRPNYKRTKKDSNKNATKKAKPNVNVVDQLKLLEEKEKHDRVEDDPTQKPKAKAVSDEENEEEENEMEDEEMDDENDYGNNYFDNGESFNDEDDNLDDGPVY